ncbi:hypothetical protein ACLOJK_025562 [Asimina triloba]
MGKAEGEKEKERKREMGRIFSRFQGYRRLHRVFLLATTLSFFFLSPPLSLFLSLSLLLFGAFDEAQSLKQMTISMGFSSGDGSDPKDCHLQKTSTTAAAAAVPDPAAGGGGGGGGGSTAVETRGSAVAAAVGVDAIAACSLHGHGIEFEAEFKPIEHPQEPNDEDQPVKCPMPNSSLLNDGAARKERAAETLRKRAEISEMDEEEDGMVIDIQPPAQAVRKRHQTLARDRMGLPSFPPAHPQHATNILQVLRECNEFESS